MCLEIHKHIICFLMFTQRTSSLAELHADGGKDEPVADDLYEALYADAASECDFAAGMEPWPDDDASGRDPLVPPCPDPPLLAQLVMDLP